MIKFRNVNDEYVLLDTTEEEWHHIKSIIARINVFYKSTELMYHGISWEAITAAHVYIQQYEKPQRLLRKSHFRTIHTAICQNEALIIPGMTPEAYLDFTNQFLYLDLNNTVWGG